MATLNQEETGGSKKKKTHKHVKDASAAELSLIHI